MAMESPAEKLAYVALINPKKEGRMMLSVSWTLTPIPKAMGD